MSQFTYLNWREHSDGRQNAPSFRASIVTADKVCDATGWNTTTADRVSDATGRSTLAADRVLATTAEILSQPIEYFFHLRKHRDGRQSISLDEKKNSNGRQSTRHYEIEYSNGRQSTQCYKMEYSNGRQSS